MTEAVKIFSDVDQEISRLAQDLARREGINLEAATLRVFNERSDLAKTWVECFVFGAVQ